MRRRIAFALTPLIMLVGLSTPQAQGDLIPGLYTTGVDNSGNVLGLGVADPHYIVLDGANPGSNAMTMSSIPGNYIPNNSTSLWVWENANGQPTNVTRTFRTTFDLTGLDPSTASITGSWATDDYGPDIEINGVSTGQISPGFSSFTTFSITSGFVSGLNTIDFVDLDVGVISGFRVGSISGTAAPQAVPEPSSLAMIISAVGLIFGWRWKRRGGAGGRVACPRLRGHVGEASGPQTCPRRRGHATRPQPPAASKISEVAYCNRVSMSLASGGRQWPHARGANG